VGLNVAVLGASDDQDRYSYKALQMLLEHNHRVFPVHPKLEFIEGYKIYKDINSIPDQIHTLTIYVRPELSSLVREQILKLKPKRVIFNPGTENPALAHELKQNGISTLEACTLVLLRTGQFEI
jgi:predicted CoA-binding protein